MMRPSTVRRLGIAVAMLAGVAIAPPTVAAGAGHQLYVSGVASRAISGLDAAPDGELTPLTGSPFANGSSPFVVLASPDGRHVYATDNDAGTVSGYAVGADGGLTPVPGSPFATEPLPFGAAFSPDGRNLYVAANTSIDAFAVHADGALSRLPGAPFAFGTAPGIGEVGVTPDGRHLYAIDSGSAGGSGAIVAFTIAADGRLDRIAGRATAGGTPLYPAITPDGRHLYTANEGGGVSAFTIRADGTLAPVPGSPFPAGSVPHGAIVTPDGRHLFVPNTFSSSVSAYAIAADGALEPLPGSPFAGAVFPASGAISPDGQRLYVTQHVTATAFPDSAVRVFKIASDGTLAPVGPANGTPTGVAFSDGHSTTITPDQPPTARFTITPGRNPTRVSLNAAASSDPDGRIDRYEWRFGDNTTRTTHGPLAHHAYRTDAPHRVTLTVTDDDGCSIRLVFTGQTATCNGAPTARATHDVTFTFRPPPPAHG